MEPDEKTFDFYECQVCLRSLLQGRPRLLQCGHTFCQTCLSQLIHREHVICPKCRTPTETSRVDGLPMNTDIQKFRGREKELVLGPNAICRKCFLDVFTTKIAKWKCIDCSSDFCDDCAQHHDSLLIFKSHCLEPLEVKVTNRGDMPLCTSHGFELAFICMECCTQACKDCAIEMEHANHSEHLTTFQEGISTLREKAGKLLEEANRAKLSYDTFLQTCQNRKFGFQKLREMTLATVSDLKNILKEPDDHSFASAFMTIRQDVNNNLEWIDRLTSKCGGEFLVTDAEIVTVPTNASSIPVTRPQQLLALTPGQSVKIRCPAELSVSDDGHGFYVDNRMGFIQRINQVGKVVQQYHPHSHVGSQINDACVYGNYLYIGQRTGISVMPLNCRGEEDIRVYRPNTPRLTTFRVYDETMFVMADHTVGEVVTYEPLQDKTTVVVQGLDNPQFVGIIHTTDGVKYTVTEGRRGHGWIRIYDHNWQLINTIVGEGDSPNLRGTQVTPSGSLLIADRENNLISEYTCSGHLMRHILTEEDGLYSPTCLAYKHPWLWFTEKEYNHMAIKLFNLEPETDGQFR